MPAFVGDEIRWDRLCDTMNQLLFGALDSIWQILWRKISRMNGDKKKKSIILYCPTHTHTIRSCRYTYISRSFASFFWIFFWIQFCFSIEWATMRTRKIETKMWVRARVSLSTTLNGCRTTKDKYTFLYINLLKRNTSSCIERQMGKNGEEASASVFGYYTSNAIRRNTPAKWMAAAKAIEALRARIIGTDAHV